MLLSFEQINNILLSENISISGCFHIGAHECEELTFYNNSDSIDHLSKRDTNRFMQYFGLFDYVNWALNNSNSRFVFFRLFLRLARKFI
jgi:hypothetical protein